MSSDISHILESWDYKPGQVVVRRLKGRDGKDKIQLRVDLGLLQMNAEGRPDGKRPMGHPSLLDFFKHRLLKHEETVLDEEDEFTLSDEDCSRLQLEVLQFHHRYLCLLQLQDFEGAARDARHNLEIFDFAEEFAESEEMAWGLKQFQPHVLMVLARAKASQALAKGNYDLAISRVKEGISSLRDFYIEHERDEQMEHSSEIRSLEHWLEQIRSDKPLTSRQLLEKALQDAVANEDYERAAEMRDALNNLKPKPRK